MRLMIEFDCDNAAFEDDFEGEVGRILADLSERLSRRRVCDPYSLRDSNGNHVGTATLAPRNVAREMLHEAAPDMLAALVDMQSAYDLGFDLPWGTLRQAIAKATGVQA